MKLITINVPVDFLFTQLTEHKSFDDYSLEQSKISLKDYHYDFKLDSVVKPELCIRQSIT